MLCFPSSPGIRGAPRRGLAGSRVRGAAVAGNLRFLIPKRRLNLRSMFILSSGVEISLAQAASLFTPHPNLGDEVNHNIVESEIEGGVFLKDLPSTTVLQIQTQNHCYTAVLVDEGSVLISGHPEYCPQPVLVAIAGSTWGGSMLKRRYVDRGMHLEFRHPEYRTPIVTSPIREIRECARLSQPEVAALV